MDRNSKRKRQNKRPNKRRGRKVQTIQRFRRQPETYKVSLIARDYDTLNFTSSPYWYRAGILEPLGRIPQFMATFFTMYRKARIVHSTISVKLVNTGATEPIELIIGTMPFNWVTGSPTISEIVGKVGTRRHISSAAGGMDRSSLSRAVSCKTLLGHEYMLADYDFSLAQASSTIPIDSEEPIWIVAATALNSTSPIDCKLEIVATYDVEFFDLFTS